MALGGGEVGGEAVEVEGDEGLLGVGGEEEVEVGLGVHEEVLGEDGGAAGVLEDVEGALEVGVGVGVVHAEAFAGEVELGGVVEARGQVVGRRLARRGVGAPARGVVPAVPAARRVHVDRHQDHIPRAEPVAEPVRPQHPLRQRHIPVLRHQQLRVQPIGLEPCHDTPRQHTIILPFQEPPVRTPLAHRLLPVTIVD